MKTGRNAQPPKHGGGRGNWGDTKSDIEALTDPVDPDAPVADTEGGDNKPQDAGNQNYEGDEQPKEPEKPTFSLKTFEKQQRKKQQELQKSLLDDQKPKAPREVEKPKDFDKYVQKTTEEPGKAKPKEEKKPKTAKPAAGAEQPSIELGFYAPPRDSPQAQRRGQGRGRGKRRR